MLIGLISDTHGLMRPEAVEALTGVDLILHAGDVGGRAVLHTLGLLAPVRAVFGNVDNPGEPGLEPSIRAMYEGVSVHVSHGHELGRPTPERLLSRYDADVIVYGHTHRPLIHESGARLVINPGAAGPRRFSLQPSVARLRLEGGDAAAELVWL